MSSLQDRYWIIYLAAIICIGLVLVGGLMYPMNLRDPLEIILFEVVSLVIIIAIIRLIYVRGLPDAVTEARKQTVSD